MRVPFLFCSCHHMNKKRLHFQILKQTPPCMQPVQKQNADLDFPPCTGCFFQKPLHQLEIYNGVSLSCLIEEGAFANVSKSRISLKT